MPNIRQCIHAGATNSPGRDEQQLRKQNETCRRQTASMTTTMTTTTARMIAERICRTHALHECKHARARTPITCHLHHCLVAGVHPERRARAYLLRLERHRRHDIERAVVQAVEQPPHVEVVPLLLLLLFLSLLPRLLVVAVVAVVRTPWVLQHEIPQTPRLVRVAQQVRGPPVGSLADPPRPAPRSAPLALLLLPVLDFVAARWWWRRRRRRWWRRIDELKVGAGQILQFEPVCV